MIKNLLYKAFVLKRKGYYKYAIEILYKALEEDNSSVELLLEIAELFYLLGNEEHALNYIEQVIKQNPMHIDSLKLLKQIFLEKKAFDKAEQTAKNIYCISMSESDLAEILRILNIQKKYQEVVEYMIETSNVNVIYEKAFALYKLHKNSEAEAMLSRIPDCNKNETNILLLLCQIQYQKGDMDYCSKILESINDIENNAEALYISGLVHLKNKNCEKAISDLISATKLDSKNPEYYYALGNVYYELHDFTSSKKYYNKSIALNPSSLKYHFSLAKLYYDEKHYRRALLEIQGNSYEERLLKIMILYDTGYLALAKKELNSLEPIYLQSEIVQEYKTKIYKALNIIAN